MKNLTTIAATLGAAILLAGSPALAADTQSGPIHIDALELVSQSLGEAPTNIRPISADIAFTNTNDAPATNVQFALVSDNGTVLKYFNDQGTFSKGVTIRYSVPDNEDVSNGQQLAVAKATFADGTVWTNGAVPAEISAQPIPATPVVPVALNLGDEF